MTAVPPIQKACAGKRWLSTGAVHPDGPHVEVYVGATACGLLQPRVDLCAIRRPDFQPPARFAWGSRSAEAWLLAVSILDDAFGFESERAVRLAPQMIDAIVSRWPIRMPWVLRYEVVALRIARWEDDLEEKC